MGKVKARTKVKKTGGSKANTKEIENLTDKNSFQNTLMGKSLIEEKKTPGMFRLSCVIKPNARVNRIYSEETQIFIDTTSPPVKGKANIAIIHLLHKILHVPKSHIHLVKGQTKSQKIFNIWAPNLTCDKIWHVISQKSEL